MGEQFGHMNDQQRRQQDELRDYLDSSRPILEKDARRRHDLETKARRKAERQQRDYEAELDAQLDAEETVLREQERDAAAAAAETDPRRIWAAEKLKEREREEIARLAERGIFVKIPDWSVIRLQDLAARRRQRADERHAEAERKANIPARQRRWEDGQDKINRDAEEALISEDERHFRAREAITARRDEQLQALGEYPVLPRQPVVVPSVPFLEGPEKGRARLGASARELQTTEALGQIVGEPKVSPARREFSAIKARVRGRR
jgi:hypothetical protein